MRPLSPGSSTIFKLLGTSRRRAILATLIGLVALAAVGSWGVRAIISGQLQARYGGRISYRSWWVGASSSGLKSLALNEGESADTPVWARAERVATDLTLGGLLRGRTTPRKITLVRPDLTFRIGLKGEPLTRPPLKGKDRGAAEGMPDIVVESGRVTIRQEGRPEMVVEPVFASITPGDRAETLRARVDSDTWGKWSAVGSFAPGFRAGQIALTSDSPLIASSTNTAMIPFVPADVWDHVAPRGPVRVAIDVATGEKPTIVTRGEFLGTTLHLATLGLVAEGATGKMTVDGRVVTIEEVKGRALGGEVSASGILDFAQDPPRFDLKLNLKGVDVAATPKSWGLVEAGISGKLTGAAHLLVTLAKDGVVMDGTEGSGVVEDATLAGIRLKGLKLAMRANGDSLQYEPTPDEEVNRQDAKEHQEREQFDSSHSHFTAQRMISAILCVICGETLLSYVPQDPPKPKGGFVRPRSLTTQVEFEDADLVDVVAKARGLGIPLPFVVAGKLSVKAKATIPLGTLGDIRGYVFHGRASLKGTSIAGVDFGSIVAQLDLEKGVLDLTDLRGRLVDDPMGRVANPPAETEPAPVAGPMPRGGFRGRLRAELSPRGTISAAFEGFELPIGELLATALPHPTPISGLTSFRIEAEGDAARLGDPMAWTVDGNLQGESVRYRGAMIDRASSTFSLKEGHVRMPAILAILEGHPLDASLAFDVMPPYRFDATAKVEGWNLDAALAFVPSLPQPSPVGGLLDLHIKGKGSLQPRELAIDGDGFVRRFRAGPVALGDIPIRWRTEPDRIRVTIDDARPLGGELSAEADIPTHGDGPIRGWASLSKFDVATVSAVLPKGEVKISGRADGQGTFTVRPKPKVGESSIEGNLRLSAPEMTVLGVPARAIQVVLSASGGDLAYDAYAESLGGKIGFKGTAPLTGSDPEANATLQAVGFRIEGLSKPLGLEGAAAKLEGVAAINANLRTHLIKQDLRARGLVEVRDLKWGPDFPIGIVKGTVTVTPDGWRVDPLSGDVLGGAAKGSIVSDRADEGPPRLSFNLEIQRASLEQSMALIPTLARSLEGEGTLRMSGRMAENLRADGEVIVPTGKIFGLPVSELRAPGEMQYAPGGGRGTLRVRRWSARFAGGRLTGDATFGVGRDRSFSVDSQLASIDLESLIRVLTDARKPSSGKVSGKLSMHGPDPSRLDRLQGRIDLDLDDAALVELPVFSQIDRFLGSARGGIFEHGELHAVIGNRQVTLEAMSLAGRLVQLHATGTVGLDGRLELVVLVNTKDIIGQTGQILAALVPGLNEASGRRGAGKARFANFLSNRLLKFRVGGTVASPSVELDPAVAVGEAAVGFFAGALKLPLELLR